MVLYGPSKTLFLQSADIVTSGGANDTVTSDFVTSFALMLCTRLLLFFSIYSGGKQALDAFSSSTVTVSEEREESTSCVSPALLWNIFEMLFDRYLLPTCWWMSCLWATDACLKTHQFGGISKLTDSLFERWHEDKWAKPYCGEWCITDIILP